LISHNISFAKIDSPAYKNFTQKYEAFSYPTIALFSRGIPLPVFYRKEREEHKLAEYLLRVINSFEQPQLLEHIGKMTPEQIVGSKLAIFKGKKDSYEYRAWDVVAKRDGYIEWAFVEDETPKVVIGTL
jgi:hypothetical protein